MHSSADTITDTAYTAIAASRRRGCHTYPSKREIFLPKASLESCGLKLDRKIEVEQQKDSIHRYQMEEKPREGTVWLKQSFHAQMATGRRLLLWRSCRTPVTSLPACRCG